MDRNYSNCYLQYYSTQNLCKSCKLDSFHLTKILNDFFVFLFQRKPNINYNNCNNNSENMFATGETIFQKTRVSNDMACFSKTYQEKGSQALNNKHFFYIKIIKQVP